MGYAYYTLADGRKAGYGVSATCDEPDCDEKIDRGLGYLCGEDPGDGGEHGCGGYFCGEHLYGGEPGQCKRCLESTPFDDEDK